MLSIGKHGARSTPNTNRETRTGGAGRRKRTGSSVLRQRFDGQNKGVSRTSFTSSFGIACPAWCGTCQAPRSTCQCQYYSQQKRRRAGEGEREGSRNAVGVGRHIRVCIRLCVCVCQFSQLTATVAEPHATHHAPCTMHALYNTGLNQLQLSNGRDYKCNSSGGRGPSSRPAYYCN